MDPTNANTALCSAFAEELARSGVRRAVVSPGSRSTPLAVALWREPAIEVTVVIDERSAGFMALGAAQASESPVALLCTSGTAGANYHPAVAEADLSGIPLVVMTADRPPELRDNGSGQTIDQIKLFGSSVRWFTEVGNHAADDAGLLHFRGTACRAVSVAAGDPRPGPVHLNFPFREPLAPVPDPAAVTATYPLALNGRADATGSGADTTGSGANTTGSGVNTTGSGADTTDGDPATPLVRVHPASPGPPEEAELDRLTTRLAGTSRVLILAGRQTDPALRGPVTRLAEVLGCPILAEPTSQLLCGPHDRGRVIAGYARLGASAQYGRSGFLDRPELAPDVVLRFGEMPTSKGLRLWLADLDRPDQVVIDPLHGWNEPTGRAGLILRSDPATTADALADRLAAGGATAGPTGNSRVAGGRNYLESWQAAARDLPEPDPDGTGPFYRTLAETMPDGGLIYVNSSMPIRDLESFTPSLPSDLTFLANRGANGIDGLTASGLGATLATGRPTVIVTGDVAFLHDIGSLANWPGLENRPHILVFDNGGGAIFNRLPQKTAMPPEEFEALMSTPPNLEIGAAAALFGLPYHPVEDPAGLSAALRSQPGLIHVRTADPA